MSGQVAPRNAAAPEASSSAFERWLLGNLIKIVGNPPLGLELWDGYHVGPESPAPVIVFEERRALYRAFYKPELAFGELFTRGRMTVRGDLVKTMEAVYAGLAALETHDRRYLRLMRTLLARRTRRNTVARAKHNISAHYDLGNDFYALWLDAPYMQYTCAYYPTPTVSLDAAQQAKLELVCRKLALKPGERVVEAGGGWGGLARYLARHHGVRVRSYNISGEQVAWARQRAAEEGLYGMVEYVEDDYRNIQGTYDAFVSVGMLEHVGVRNYARLGEVIDRCLTDAGRGLIHSIGQDEARPLNEWIETRIFPGAEPPTLEQMTRIFAPLQFILCDVENLRPHYARTLLHWLERFEAHAEQIEGMFDADFVRMWRLYLCGSAAAFSRGRMQLFQLVFRRPHSRALPETREHMFREPFVDAVSPDETIT